ncbi:M1-specific T cell receptor alpha chain-like [Aythya fuligula]|uniref:M1-specific T cell receptor alpha chain-like n=1 Tax=Aythya fuligula TaxID=219594 RepID=UPI001375C387|nr:M1-specific T cell receptor alpha chain-like [Aythya fuligula]
MRQGRAAGLAALAAVLLVAAGRAQVQQEPWAETREGTGINITCSHPNMQTSDYIYWYRQLPGQGPAFLVSAFSGSNALTDLPGRLSVAADRRSSALWLTEPRLRDAAVYYCALRSLRTLNPYGLDKLVFGSGTTLTVEPSNQKDSDPEVVLIKSKALEEGGSTGKAACLARNFYPKNISLDMLTAEVIYEQSTPIVTSEGTYNTIKVVNVAKNSEVSCTAKFKNKSFPANAMSSEKVVEEPITANVCNTTDISSKGDIKTEKTNMLSMAVLGLRVLLAKSIAFNTLMSIKLFLF